MSTAQNRPSLQGARVLVTGATGAIGGRLVEKLVLERGAQVSVLARKLARGVRVARYPVTMYQGDVTDPAAVGAAMQGCDYVFHCAYGNAVDERVQRHVNVEGTRVILDAALRSGVRQAVHVSTCSVYGFVPPDGALDETAARRRSGNVYADSKLEAEELALRYAREANLPVAVVQPTAVYGPGVPVWTNSVLARLKRERVFLVNGGEGLCNAVYVDDVVDGMMQAAECPDAVGEAFLLSGPDVRTWRDFYRAYEAMLGVQATVSARAEEVASHWRAWTRTQRAPSIFLEPWRMLKEENVVRKRIKHCRETKYVLAAAHSLRARLKGDTAPRRACAAGGGVQQGEIPPSLPVQPLSPEMARFYCAKPRFDIDKARRVLGYSPRFDLDGGMDLTRRWAHWANLLA